MKNLHRSWKIVLTAVVLVTAIFAPGLALGVGAIGAFGGGIFDAAQMFSNAQALASAASTNVIDLREERRIGSGVPMCVVVVITTALDGTTGDETYTVTIQSDMDEAFGSPATVLAAYSLPRGSAAGTRFILPIPQGTLTERYIRLLYAVGGTTPVGAVTAFLSPLELADTTGERTFYADAITISI